MPRPSSGEARKVSPKAVRPLSPSQIPSALTRFSAPIGTDRYNAGKSLIVTAGKFPDRLYPHFHTLATFLSSESNIIRWTAQRVLSLLAPVDTDHHIDRLLELYLTPIHGHQMISAANSVQGAARIALTKPHLLPRILPEILSVASATYETPECRNVAIAHALDALKLLWPTVKDNSAVQHFIRQQTTNPRHSAAKRARTLLIRM